ncbi:Kdo hydroxylase family protein [Erwinia sorbitola]|uniref:3-deoxy-D-manno-oct-2-ulosonic acid (Kdo) hydroxylase n=1 Tax=Erwinia sorbitola TaxID=2681984 RepID=A0A6I6EEY1_9GAMM|nr:Kdo hydroxylase family protein [Erwinia sorbitola]QGU87108.1 3-deoxy-D-manno-oct-2-ulosonic acid (Kdo) hydroxylase [Erwinia sorbitola]
MSEQALSRDRVIRTLPLTHWNQPHHDSGALASLEQGNVLFLPHLSFTLMPEELKLLDPALVAPKRKNITFDPQHNRVRGLARQQYAQQVTDLLSRYYQHCLQLIDALLPEYRHAVHSPSNTLRLHPVSTWRSKSSWRKDDSRLHVDAFPSRPIHGERILRIFNNINPHGENREWRVGEPFPVLAQRFMPHLSGYSPLSSWFQQRIGMTKSLRSRYDHMMLRLHDAMKADRKYQEQGPQVTLSLPPGSSWICFADQTPHAAMSGQFMLEQTFLLPVSAMLNPQNSPLAVLEKLMQQPLL